MTRLTISTAILLTLSTISEAVRYGDNHVAVSRDNDLVAAQFPNVENKLLSPAFASPETVPSGFLEGIAGPTDDLTLGLRLNLPLYRRNC